jgi:hypothetical protein
MASKRNDLHLSFVGVVHTFIAKIVSFVQSEMGREMSSPFDRRRIVGSVSKKRISGRYQLQFPLEWVRERLAGRTAEAWRADILVAFDSAEASVRQAWRNDFELEKKYMMKSTLRVENRTGRRFDRVAYCEEAQKVYGVASVPPNASPKLLSRCFQHSIDFALCNRLIDPTIATSGHMSSAVSTVVSTPSTSEQPTRFRGLNITRRWHSVTDSCLSSGDGLQACEILSAAESAPLTEHTQDDPDEFFSESLIDTLTFGDGPIREESMEIDFGDGMLLDDDDCQSLYPLGGLFDAGASPGAHLHALRVSDERHPSVTCSVLQRSWEFGDWPCTANTMQVWTTADVLRRVAPLERDLAELKKDLDAARNQRDKAVRDCQAAAAREAAVLRQLDAVRNTVEDAPSV